MAITRNLTIDQGSTFGAVVDIADPQGQAYDLTDHTATAVVRKAPTSTNTSAVFTCAIPNGIDGAVYLSLTDEETLAMKPGRYMYDLYVENSSGQRYRAIEGLVTVTPAITR